MLSEAFLHAYLDRSSTDDLSTRSDDELHALAQAHRSLGDVRGPTGVNVRVYRPEQERDGWASSRWVLDIVVDDMPFVVDSVTMALAARSLRIVTLIHPVLRVIRDGDGRFVDLGSADDHEGTFESFLHVELEAPGEVDVAELSHAIEGVLIDVRHAVEDWSAMRAHAESIARELITSAKRLPVAREEIDEAVAFLRWLAAERFTFLGYREYDLEPVAVEAAGGDTVLRAVPGSGLGILRVDPDAPPEPTHLSPVLAERAREPALLVLTKANARSTVHRPVRLDYVGVKRFDADGNVVGERRFLGLYTSAAYNTSAFDVPVLRRKALEVVRRAGFPRQGHSTRRLADIIETYPKDELFQIATDELYENAMGILQLQDRQEVRLFRRVDPFERSVSCLVYVPRDRYTTAVRERMRDILVEAHDATAIDYSARITEHPLARLLFVLHTVPGQLPPFVHSVVEARLAAAARSWTDDLQESLRHHNELARADELFAAYGDAFPIAYRDEFTVDVAERDIEHLYGLDADGDLAFAIYRPPGGFGAIRRLKVYRSGERISLSAVLPVLENLGLTVVDERPYAITVGDHIPRWIYDFGLQLPEEAAAVLDRENERFFDALAAVWRGDAESDGFNRLVLAAQLSWRQVVVLRTYRRYLRQVGVTFSLAYIERCLAGRPELVRLLMALFDARFNPDRPVHEGSRQDDIDALALQVEVSLELIENLDEDRILRSFYRLIQATMRTNFHQFDGHDRKGHLRPKPYLAVKLDPRMVPDLPEPRPKHEIFVHSPRVEGAHLRGADVARGGLRWSDRPEDFRTEILGLMKAQLVKNSVIVPSGAKGGFIVRQPPPAGDREALREEGIACYRDFISALLDLTDNLVDGVAVPPDRVVRHDGDDTYLVVAADKGTASFSDIANELAVARGFWLGDAFASGGSSGYDHKKMGITARGAWESVKRHFRELGIDVQTTDVTVVGIGDMSGDVFGNGMLLSRHIKLVGAFDHRHVFLDPDPDPEASYEERRRLFEKPQSSWNDYDRSRLSRGGGVFARTAKSIPLSEEIRAVLGVEETALPPPDLIRALLKAPVDLLWNGGIGTYVKAATENNADVGDKANDVVRVNGGELRCRVVGEGGNLGLTQRGRVEYALAGGHVYTDAIDNSAGVDCSDHEVNLKILLDSLVRKRELDRTERDALLVAMTDEVAAHVVHENYAHTQALSIARVQARSLADVHGRYITSLEQHGRIDRELESLPTEEELAERRARGQGLTTPELAILLAYAKVTLDREILKSDLPEDPFLAATLAAYFPRSVRDRYAKQIQSHPLRREIIATCVSNVVVNRGGTSMLYRLSDETQAPLDLIARCHLTAASIFAMPALWSRVQALDNVVAVETQIRMLLASRRLVERATRWLLQSRRQPLDISSTVWFFASGMRDVIANLPGVLVGSDLARWQATIDALERDGVPSDLAREIAALDPMIAALDLVEVADQSHRPVQEAAAIYFRLADRLRLDWLRDQIVALPRDDRWQTLARASLRADLLAGQRAMTADIVSSDGSQPSVDPGAAIDRWLDQRPTALTRYDSLLKDISGGETSDLAILTVAVGAVDELAQS